MPDSIGVAVIGAGMAGRSHAAGYRSAPRVGAGLPPVDLVAIADLNPAFAEDTARRFGYARAEISWQAIADGAGHRRGQRGGRQPPAPRGGPGAAGRRQARAVREAVRADVGDAEAMVAAAGAAPHLQAGVGFTFRRSPAIAAVKQRVDSGAIGRPALQRPLLVRLRQRPERPDELALQGRPGLRRAGRHRQPPGGLGRVPVRPDHLGARRGAVDLRRAARRCRWAPRSGHAATSSATSPSRWRTRTW